MDYYNYDNYLMHHGVKGMKWGVRRYQNSDGTLTSAGKARKDENSTTKKPVDTRLDTAQRVGKKSMSSYQKLNDEYSPRIQKAMNQGDYETAGKIEDEYNERIQKEVYEPLYKAGYDFVSRGGGSNGFLNLQYGKYLDDPEYDDYGNEIWADEYMVENGDMKAYRVSDDW